MDAFAIPGRASSLARSVSAGQVNLRPIVAHACDLARGHGVCEGMSLADARALCPGLIDLPHDPAKDAHSLEALARWLMRFTPDVALEGSDAIFLDVTGCEELFGGLDRLLGLVTSSIARMGLRANVVIAPTPGAAWAIASCGSFGKKPLSDNPKGCPPERTREGSGIDPRLTQILREYAQDDKPNKSDQVRANAQGASSAGLNRIITPKQLLLALHSLPPYALRLEPAVRDALHKVGIDTIGQLLALPRNTLPARFGDQLLLRLDQALGRTPELLPLLDHRSPIKAQMRFDYAIDSLETIWEIFRRLIAQVTTELRRRGCGARQLVLRFERDRAQPLEHTVLLSAASRDDRNLINLLRCALEKIETHQGFTGFFLGVPVFEKLAEEQSLLMGQKERDAQVESLRLIERLRARFGERTVEAAQPVESHLPERACAYVEAAAISNRPADKTKFAVVSTDPDIHAPSTDRPLHLLAAPVEIAVIVSPSEDREGHPISLTFRGKVHRLACSIGPERIAGIWWDGHNKTRDYFEVEDDAGLRFWIFRVMETWRWFLHGSFA